MKQNSVFKKILKTGYLMKKLAKLIHQQISLMFSDALVLKKKGQLHFVINELIYLLKNYLFLLALMCVYFKIQFNDLFNLFKKICYYSSSIF